MATLQCDCGYDTTTTNPSEANMCFGAVEITTAVTQEKEVDPALEQQIITPDAGYTAMHQVTVNAVDATIDPNIQPQNIRKGVEILSVTGILDEGGTGSGGTMRVDTRALLPSVGDINFIYIVKDENALYRWDEDNLKYVPVARNYEEITLIDCGTAGSEV